MDARQRELWISRNSIETNIQEIEDLMKYFNVDSFRLQAFSEGECISVNRGLEVFKIVVDSEECKIKLFGKNTKSNGKYKRLDKKEKLRFICSFEGANAWYDVLYSLFNNRRK